MRSTNQAVQSTAARDGRQCNNVLIQISRIADPKANIGGPVPISSSVPGDPVTLFAVLSLGADQRPALDFLSGYNLC